MTDRIIIVYADDGARGDLLRDLQRYIEDSYYIDEDEYIAEDPDCEPIRYQVEISVTKIDNPK
jgi:hypothetical protein